MSEIKTGGPAFPFAFNEEDRVSDGMSLRDYFAAKAMQGDWACSNSLIESKGIEYAAERYYFMADAMLQARES